MMTMMKMETAETMALMSDVDMPLDVLRTQIGSAIDIIVQVARTESGRRRVTHIVEVIGFDPREGYTLRNLFESEVSK